MYNLMSLFATVALVVIKCQTTNANIIGKSNKIEIDNSLQPNVVPAPRRRLRNFIHLSSAPPPTVQFDGAPVTLTCEFMGLPVPLVRWLRNDMPADEYEEETNEIPPYHPSGLARVTSSIVVTTVENGDRFTCVAASGVIQKSSTTTIYSDEGADSLLIRKLYSAPSKPIITLYFNELLQDAGTSVVLPCRASARAQLYWQDSEGNVIYRDSRLRVLPSGDLLIPSVKFSDMGEYTCVVKNVYGSDSITTFLYPTKN